MVSGRRCQWVHWGMSADAFKAKDAEYFPQGLRITSLLISNGEFAAVWQPGDGIQWVHWGMSTDDFAAQDRTYFEQGLRINLLTTDNGRLAGVWRPGEGTQWCSWRRGVVDFRTEDRAYFAQGSGSRHFTSTTTRSGLTGTRGRAACRSRSVRETTTRPAHTTAARRGRSTLGYQQERRSAPPAQAPSSGSRRI